MSAGHTPGPWGTDEADHDAPYQNIKQVNEALPVTFNRIKETGAYRTGDGETKHIVRSGSQDAFTKPSKGYPT